MEDFEIELAIRKEMELRNLSEKYPALDPSLFTPWAAEPNPKFEEVEVEAIDAHLERLD